MTNRTQLFASPLGDGVAKYILSSDERFRNYILSALSGYTIKSSEQLDDHLNPFDSNKDLRALINSKYSFSYAAYTCLELILKCTRFY